MKLVGITGGIGSGKTTVSKVFAVLGIPIFYADAAGRSVLDEDQQARREIAKLLGPSVFDAETGKADRAAIGDMVFRHPEMLEALSEIVHPAVGRMWHKFVEAHPSAPYVMKEAAILFESGSHQGLDAVIAVSAPKEMRIQRVLQRDDTTRQAIEDRMANQLSEEERNARANHILYNDDSRSVIQQVLELHKILAA